MRILYLSAGTGSYYCGTCMRDNAIVRQLRQRGHDIHLMPLYLPFSLDEAENTDCPLFFGGINAYLQQKVGLFRHTPRFFDRLLDWKPLLRMSAQMADMTKAHEHGDMTISMLKGADGFQRKEVQRMLAWVREQLPPLDVVVISNLMLAGVGVALKRALGLPLIASMQGEDSYLDGLPEAQKEEAWQLLRDTCREIDVLIGVSAFFARYMGERLALADEQLRVIDNGIELDGYQVADRRPEPPELGFFAHITPSKGLHTVVDAFIAVANEPAFASWRLAIGGSCTKADERYLNEQRDKLARAGLSERVRYATNLTKEEKQAFYRSISVLAVAPTYPEAFGLYVIETLASGTPLLVPQRGALPELVEQLGGGVAFPVTEPQADAVALADALRQTAGSTEGLAAFQAQAVAARAQVHERFTDAAMAEAFAKLLEEVVARDGRPQEQQG